MYEKPKQWKDTNHEDFPLFIEEIKNISEITQLRSRNTKMEHNPDRVQNVTLENRAFIAEITVNGANDSASKTKKIMLLISKSVNNLRDYQYGSGEAEWRLIDYVELNQKQSNGTVHFCHDHENPDIDDPLFVPLAKRVDPHTGNLKQ
ncbi:hypothetical protein GF391_01965 [Candidatus Uhrbacteria bacterium]|nr:hypothetical protein [Candidatus Uhrbacteria bacterium]